MKHHAKCASRATAFMFVASLAALGLFVPATVSAQTARDKVEAAKVAKKVEKARRAGERAEKEAQEALKDFRKEVAKYERLHAVQLARLGTRDPALVQEAMARAIVSKRDDAKPGDIFERDVQPLFRRLIAEQLKGPDTAAAREAVGEGNPTEEGSPPVLVRVNAAYPAGASRSTVPPSLLLALPPLPACLQYLFVGRDLILVDSVAQIIVDFLPAAAPALVSR
jgi:hypothetical protein